VTVTDDDYGDRAARHLAVSNPDAAGGKSDPFGLARVEGW
jgi:hypothetical protein